MSSLEERPAEKLFDMILNVLWQDLLEVWKALRKKLDAEGRDTIKNAFTNSLKRFDEGPFQDRKEVRWGMDLCMHCNDDNIEKNGIAYVQPSGDGLEFNQCLNCRIGILYNLEAAKATLDTYTVGLGEPDQFNGMSFYWDAIVPEDFEEFQPSYQIIKEGQWMGTVSIDESFIPKFIPFESMTASIPRTSKDPWTTDIPQEVKAAVDAFIEEAKDQIEVANALK